MRTHKLISLLAFGYIIAAIGIAGPGCGGGSDGGTTTEPPIDDGAGGGDDIVDIKGLIPGALSMLIGQSSGGATSQALFSSLGSYTLDDAAGATSVKLGKDVFLPPELYGACLPEIVLEAEGVVCSLTCVDTKDAHQELLIDGSCTFTDYAWGEYLFNGAVTMDARIGPPYLDGSIVYSNFIYPAEGSAFSMTAGADEATIKWLWLENKSATALEVAGFDILLDINPKVIWFYFNGNEYYCSSPPAWLDEGIPEGAELECVEHDTMCEDGADNDFDGLIDCYDDDCSDYPKCSGDYEDCFNGVDDNGDGRIDCADPYCYDQCFETMCIGGGDEDGDGLIDCADPDCALEEHCAWPVDCYDPANCSLGECQFYNACETGYGPGLDVNKCSNAPEDDDGDGAIDAQDIGCAMAYVTVNGAPAYIHVEDCSCGYACGPADPDLDGDGAKGCDDLYCVMTDPACNACGTPFYGGIYYPPPMCDENDEIQPGSGLACADYRGRPYDGAFYLMRPACAQDGCCIPAREDGVAYGCVNRFDDDHDGILDCMEKECEFDFNCLNMEHNCTDGRDNDGDSYADCNDSDCWGYANCPEVCNDTIVDSDLQFGLGVVCDDEDWDGVANCADPDCTAHPYCQGLTEESSANGNCADGVDNDNDCKMDCGGDPDCVWTCVPGDRDGDGDPCDRGHCESEQSCPADCIKGK